MLSNDRIEYLKQSFYGREHCVENNISPTITSEEIILLSNVFYDLEDLKKENNLLKKEIKKIKRKEEFDWDVGY